MQIFSSEWIVALGNALRNSDAYRQQAQTWEGSILLVLVETSTPQDRAVWLDLWHGDCRDAREATPADFDTADYILAADWQQWQQLLHKKIEPLMAVMRGKLKLNKGSMTTLARYANAAKELVNAAASIPAEWVL